MTLFLTPFRPTTIFLVEVLSQMFHFFLCKFSLTHTTTVNETFSLNILLCKNEHTRIQERPS